MMDSDTCCANSCTPALKADNKHVRIGLWLVIFTILYNILESIIAIFSGYKTDSVALLGFGFDSLIEVSAAILLLWRLTVQIRQADEEVVEKAETTVHRFVGFTFFLLTAYILYEAVSVLMSRALPEHSLIGIILAGASLIVMPGLAWGKIRVARTINSAALEAEAKETIACSILSLILLVGLSLNALFGWWWADPVAGLCMIPWLVKEGIAGIKGEGCCG